MSIQTQRQRASQAITEFYQVSFFIRYWGTIGWFLGRGRPASIWVSAAAVTSVNFLLCVSVSVVLGEKQFTGLKALLLNVMWAVFSYSTNLLLISVNTRMVEFLRLRFVNYLESELHIQDVLLWASRWIGRQFPQLIVSLGFGIASALIGFNGVLSSDKFSLGQTLFYFINFFHFGVGLYGLLALLAFVLGLHKWYLALYEDDPASSSILFQLSKELSDFLLQLAFTAAIFMCLLGLTGNLTLTITIGALVLVWIPILTLFVLGYQEFSNQIIRVKYERLEKLQLKIMKLSNVEKLNKDRVAHINSLKDYHDRIKSSRNSLYNPQSFINLIGSLALPSIAAILNVIDIWQKIFGNL
jgi:hypothetical protein